MVSCEERTNCLSTLSGRSRRGKAAFSEWKWFICQLLGNRPSWS